MPNELREKIVEYLNNETSLLEVECEAAGDGLTSLIESERCAWTKLRFGDYRTGCGWPLLDYTAPLNCCPNCGKKVEVKNA